MRKKKHWKEMRQVTVEEDGSAEGALLADTNPEMTVAVSAEAPDGDRSKISVPAYFITDREGDRIRLVLPNLNIVYTGRDGLEWVTQAAALRDLRTIYRPRGMEPELDMEIETRFDQD